MNRSGGLWPPMKGGVACGSSAARRRRYEARHLPHASACLPLLRAFWPTVRPPLGLGLPLQQQAGDAVVVARDAEAKDGPHVAAIGKDRNICGGEKGFQVIGGVRLREDLVVLFGKIRCDRVEWRHPCHPPCM